MVGRPVLNTKTAEVLYYVAEDFVKLTFLQKFNIGLDLKFIDPQEVELSEEEVEERVFTGMYRTHKLSEFVNLVYKVMHD
jgi:hypothetical protein